MQKEEKIKKVSIFILCFIAASFFVPSYTLASDLILSPSSGVLTPNSSISVNVMVTNNTQAINAVSGTLSFPTDLLSVRSITRDNSIIKLWSSEPTFSNTEGTVNFEGVLFNPGFSGSQGRLLTINFVPKRVGKASVLFTAGSILANDGNATNVLGKLGVASFVSSGNVEITNGNTSTPVENPLVPNAPRVTSATNPDTNKWYTTKSPTFSWDVPAGITALRLQYDKSPSSVPENTYTNMIGTKTITVSKDGVYYMHVQFKNDHGWGAVSHFRFKIDSEQPEPFTIVFPNGSSNDDPRPVILLNSKDNLSGIDHYELKVGDGAPVLFATTTTPVTYTMPLQLPGKHTLLVKAVDKAGNSTVQSADFVVSTINSPVITSYTREVDEAGVIKVEGTTYPDTKVNIYFRSKERSVTSESVKSDMSGNFSLVLSKKMNPGVYELVAEAIDDRGAKSQLTTPVNILINQKVFFRISQMIINYVALGIMAIVAIATLIMFSVFVRSKMILLRRKLRKDLVDASDTLNQDLEDLKTDLEQELKLLKKVGNKRDLTKEEDLIVENLKRHIDMIEKNMNKKFESIRKDADL